MNLRDLKKKITEYKAANYRRVHKFHKEALSPFRVCAEIVSAIIVGLIIGSVLDSFIGTQFTFKVVCLILGCIASFRIIYKLSNSQ